MEQNREPRNKPMLLWSINISQKFCQKKYFTKKATAYNGVKTVSTINGIGRTVLVLAKKRETRPPTYHHTLEKTQNG